MLPGPDKDAHLCRPEGWVLWLSRISVKRGFLCEWTFLSWSVSLLFSRQPHAQQQLKMLLQQHSTGSQPRGSLWSQGFPSYNRKCEANRSFCFSLHFLLVCIYTFLYVSPKQRWKIFWNPYQFYDIDLKFHPSIFAIICIHLFTSFHRFGIQISLTWYAYLSECYGELDPWIKTKNSLSYWEGRALKGPVSVFSVMTFNK